MAPPDIENTKAFAEKLHRGQTDKAGAPYIGHVLRVYRNLLRLFPDASSDEQRAALLHDVIEDCDVSAGDLRRAGFSERTIAIVEAVTKRADDGLTYIERIERLVASGDISAMRVKIADLTDNSDPARLDLLTPEKALSLGKRYGRALEILRAATHTA